MTSERSEQKGLRLLPVWLPVAVVVITALSNAGAVSSSYGSRISDSEKRLDVIERDRAMQLRDYQEFKSDIRTELAEIKTNVSWIRKSLEAK